MSNTIGVSSDGKVYNADQIEKDTGLSNMCAAEMRKSISYDRITRDYSMYIDDRYVGSRSTYHQAEIELDQMIYEMLSLSHFTEAA